MTRSLTCEGCPVGEVSGEGHARFCPFIERSFDAGSVLYRTGDRADHAWYVRSGVVSLRGHRGGAQLRYPRSFIGTECAASSRYEHTATAVSEVVLCGATRDGFTAWMSQNAEALCAAACQVYGHSETLDPPEL